MRSFLAVYPDQDARTAIAEVVPDDVEEIRSTEMAEWHVTVRFLGELDEERTAAAASAARRAASSLAPLSVLLGPATALGSGSHVLFVPASGTESLAEAVDRELLEEFGPRDRPYRGHLTFARARGQRRLAVCRAGAPVHASFRAEELVLVGSTLEPQRAVHRVLERFPLGSP